MIKMFFKFTLSFAISFIVLSFNISEKPIFDHLSELTGPIGSDIQNSITKSFEHTYSKSKKLFTNSVPNFSDKVKSKKSGLKKKSDELEELKKDEIKKLDELIRKN